MPTIDTIFETLNKSVENVKQQRDESYLESLVDVGVALLEGHFPHVQHEEPLKKWLNEILDEDEKNPAILGRAFQMAILKGMLEGIHANHHMTPDTVALFVQYLVGRFIENEEAPVRIWDPACGVGNLLLHVAKQKEQSIEVYGTEVDELLVQLAAMQSSLQRVQAQLFHGDSMQASQLPKMNVVVADLPLGYYVNAGAERFQLSSQSAEPSLTHLLLMERGVEQLVEGGYAFFIIPNHLFEMKGATELRQWMHETCFIQGVIQLPSGIFKDKDAKKSIFIVQKKGAHAKQPEQVMMAELPSFKNATGMQNVLAQMDEWFKKRPR